MATLNRRERLATAQHSTGVSNVVEAVYRSESRRVLATLIRVLGDFELAEEALHDAFTAAIEQWPAEGVPANPRAWLVSAGRFKAIDSIRRRVRFNVSLAELAERLDTSGADTAVQDEEGVGDDRLRLIFICCHPALPPDARVALTLREVCGLKTEEIAGCLSHGRAHHCSTDRTRQGKDSGDANPL